MQRRHSPAWLLLSALFALALSACLPEGVRVPQSPLSALLERKSGLIAYLSSDGNIYTIDQGGQHKTSVTSDAFVDENNFMFYGLPTWSPDSQSLAFASYSGKRGENPSSMSLFTAHKDGTQLQEALKSDSPLIFYLWSPDSRRLGLISSTANNSLAFEVVSPSGDRELVDAGAPFYWSWAPDGHAILAHAGGASPAPDARLSLLQLDPTVSEQAFALPPSEFRAPAFSPNGRQVLVASPAATEGKSALFVTDAAGGNPQTLAEYDSNESIAFVWSPDGSRVAYVLADSALPGATGHLVVVDPAGKQKPVEVDGTDVYAFFWSPDSKSLAYFSRAQLAGPTPTPDASASSSSTNDPLILSLRVVDARSGKSHSVAAFPPSERFLAVIPYFDQYNPSLTIWSPDSKNLVVSAYGNDGNPGIWVVEASGHLDPRHIAEGWMGFWSWK
jgi:Tol biopolymer transport system component